MSKPSNMREALIAEAIGDVAKLLQEVEALAPMLDKSRQALVQANAGVSSSLAGFEGRMSAITENAKTQTVKYMAVTADEAARRSIDQQSRAMADAARIAFGTQLGGSMERLQATLRPLIEARQRRWETVLTYVATGAAASVVTWAVTLLVGQG